MAKLTRLEIHEFRGIRNATFEVGSKSMAVVGPNGSGKSSIADALDFLLTGDLRRLSGAGTGGVSITKYGRHVEAKPEDSWVEAEFVSSTDKNRRVKLRRSMAAASDLCGAEQMPADVAQFVDAVAESKHHMLTRREILRYVFTEPRDRGEQIAALLQLSGVDARRLEVQGGAKLAVDRAAERRAVRDTRKGSIWRSVTPAADDETQLLERVNAHRRQLGGPPLCEVKRESLCTDLVEPARAASHPLQSQRALDLLDRAEAWLSDGAAAFSTRVEAYLAEVRRLRSDVAALKSLRATGLLTSGLDELTADECPLCLREWDQAELRAVLQERLDSARAAAAEQRQLAAMRANALAEVTAVQQVVRGLADVLGDVLADDARRLRGVATALGDAAGRLLPDALTGAVPDDAERARLTDALGAPAYRTLVGALRERADALPGLAGAQRAWDELTGLGRAIDEYRDAVAGFRTAERVAQELQHASKCFVEARDAVLGGVYDDIAGRFGALYRRVHGPDETAFGAALSPTTAGLRLDVAFHGRGAHPPCALHSEGHQDSMGLCLFLTLSERLAHGRMPLLVLDDVLMSVDQGHRRAVAELLRDEYADTQFVITTHDEVWWNQLQKLGVVTSKGARRIREWSLGDGPVFAPDAGSPVAEAERALALGNVPSAALLLRRAIEEHFPEICHALGAEVRFRVDRAYQAGEFVSAATGRMTKLLSMALAASNSWNQDLTALKVADGRRNAAFGALGQEAWAVNKSLHNNEWASFTAADFAPILLAYKEFFAIFACGACDSVYRIEERGARPTALRCQCGATNYNLVRKGDRDS